MTSEQEINCYGMSQEEIESWIKNYEKSGSDRNLMAMSMLSDIQAEVEIAGEIRDNEHLRKTLNIVKYIIAKNIPTR